MDISAEHPLFVPAFIQRSALMRLGGFLLDSSLTPEAICRELRDEAIARRGHLTRSALLTPIQVDVRGGSPDHCLGTIGGGPALAALYRSPDLWRRIGEVTGLQVKPTGPAGVYIYYDQPGDFIGLHRDMVKCDVTVITCLRDIGTGSTSGGRTLMYPHRLVEDLCIVESEHQKEARTETIAENETFLILGGLIPHRILPVDGGQERIISLLCFEATGPYTWEPSAEHQ